MVSVDRSTAFAGTVALAEGRGGREMPGTASPGRFSGTSLPGVVSPASGFASVLPALPSKKAFSSHGVSSSKPCQNAFSRSRLAHSALRAASSGDSAATGGVSGATGCSWAVFTQERSRKSRSTPSRMPRSRAPKRPALLRRMMTFPAVAPAIPAAVPTAVPVAPAVLVPAEGPAARPAPGTALRAAVPATAAAEAPVAAVAAPVTPEGVSPFSGSPQSIGAVASSVPCGSRPQLTSTGWPLTTKTLSAEGMNSALRSRTPPGVSSRWGVTASRARRRAARARSASPASRRERGVPTPSSGVYQEMEA